MIFYDFPMISHYGNHPTTANTIPKRHSGISGCRKAACNHWQGDDASSEAEEQTLVTSQKSKCRCFSRKPYLRCLSNSYTQNNSACLWLGDCAFTAQRNVQTAVNSSGSIPACLNCQWVSQHNVSQWPLYSSIKPYRVPRRPVGRASIAPYKIHNSCIWALQGLCRMNWNKAL